MLGVGGKGAELFGCYARIGGSLAATAVMVIPVWIQALLPFQFMRRLAECILLGIQILFGVALVAGTIGTVWSGALVVWTRRRQKQNAIATYGLLFCTACFISLAMAEVIAKVWNAPPRSVPAPPARDPALPTTFDENDNSEVTLVVLGESSCGWRFIPKTVVRRHNRCLAARRRDSHPPVPCDRVAQPGDTLEGQYYQLSRLRSRPDIVIVYCGHNEFYARVEWSRRSTHYPDQPPNFLERADLFGRRLSALYALFQRANDKYRIEQPPSPRFIPRLIDVPSFTPAEFAASLADFRRRLDEIVCFCERVGASPFW